MVFLKAPPGSLTVLDGQQRLATLVIIFSAVRNWLQQYTESQRDATIIQEFYIGRSELGEKDAQPRLVMNAANNRIFHDLVVNAAPLDEAKKLLAGLKRHDQNRKLLEALVYAHERVWTIAAKENGWAESTARLIGLVKFLAENVSVVQLVVTSEGAAHTIFETLNDRGMELAPLDLLKNLLFSRAESLSTASVRDMEARWAQMMATLANVRPDNFLKAFWTSRHGRIRSTNLFDAFKKQYTGAKPAIALSVELLEVSEQYAALDNADDPVWAPYTEATRESVKSLRIIGSQQAHPVLLAGLAKLAPREMERLMRLLEVLIVRHLLVGGGNTGRFETACAVLARKIYSGEVTKAAAAQQEMKEFNVPDDEFKQQFRVKQERNNQKAKYFLSALEREELRGKKGRMAGELTPGNLSVEHVLPQNPGAEWSAVVRADPSIVEECAFRLGNLCLLTSDANQGLGRHAFKAKKATYEESDLLTTQDIATKQSWDRRTIDHRQARLATVAARAWRFP
jgi:hypothetical protein